MVLKNIDNLLDEQPVFLSEILSDKGKTIEEIEREIDLPFLQQQLEKALDALSYSQREILQLRYGLEDGHCYTLKEVGRMFKATREIIIQVEAEAIESLRCPLCKKLLEEFK